MFNTSLLSDQIAESAIAIIDDGNLWSEGTCTIMDMFADVEAYLQNDDQMISHSIIDALLVMLMGEYDEDMDGSLPEWYLHNEGYYDRG